MTLVATLYSRPSGILLGALGGIIAGHVAAAMTGDAVLALIANLLTALAVVRLAAALILPRIIGDRANLLAFVWFLGSTSFSLANGAQAAWALHSQFDPAVCTLLLCNAIAYAPGVAARNAAQPRGAIAQLLLALAPSSVMLMLQDNFAAVTLGLLICLLMPAMIRITLDLSLGLRDAAVAAESSAKLADRLQHIALTDPVTGLNNRLGLTERLAEEFAALVPGDKLALFWFDLDRFKEVNDTLGHAVGDQVLIEVGRRLRALAPSEAVVARFGGDEFIVACRAPDRLAIEAMASELLLDATRSMRIKQNQLVVSSSMGIAVYPDDGQDIDTVMQGADLALYHSKVNGRGRLSFFTSAMTRALVRRREIEAELRLALQRDELSIYFQPIVDLATGRIRSFEALVRWFHPEKGELRPDEFIPVAEETGVIITLGNWITAQAAKAAAKWPDDVTVAVNLSPVQIRAPGAALAILAALRDARLAPERLELEITESVLLDDGAQTEQFIAALSAAGVRFALDDFGTGYSSLSYLSKYQFSKIKVDRSFVSGTNAGIKSAAIIRATSEMAAMLNMEIVAEGLETVEQVRAVCSAGCTLGQGYYFSRPVPDYVAGMLLVEERDKLEPMRAVG